MLFFLVLLASGVTSFFVGARVGRAIKARRQLAAPPPSSDRTLLTLQVGDIVQHLDRDYLVEGAVLLSEAPRAARLCRIIDGAEERFVYATTESEDAWLLEPTAPPEGRPNDLGALRLDKRWQASTLSTGRVGARAFEPELAIHEYVGGDRLLLVLDPTHVDSIVWSEATVSGGAALPRRNGSTQREVGLDRPGRAVAFLGGRLLPHAVDILPGPGRGR